MFRTRRRGFTSMVKRLVLTAAIALTLVGAGIAATPASPASADSKCVIGAHTDYHWANAHYDYHYYDRDYVGREQHWYGSHYHRYYIYYNATHGWIYGPAKCGTWG